MIRINTLYTTCLALSLSLMAHATPLDDQIAEYQKDQTAVNESTIHTMLKQGAKEKRAAEIALVIKDWLKNHEVKDQNVMFLSARSLELSGEFEDAASFYRKLLASENVNPVLAPTAVPSFYRLMIMGMKDSQSAFLYMRKNGGALRKYGNAKQYDAWFLRQALKRQDLSAAADRFKLIHDSGDAKDHQDTLKAFMDKAETYAHSSPETLEAFKRLARAKVPNSVKLRLNWIVEIVAVNTEVNELFNARKEVPASLYGNAARAAEALVAALPFEGSILVLRGWCNYADGHTPNYIQKTGYHRKLTAPPIISALSKLTDSQFKAVINTRAPRERTVVAIFAPSDLVKLIASRPHVFNTINAPNIPLYYKGMTQKESKALAPALARNPSKDAALIRAIAAGNTTVTKAVHYIALNELWRFNEEGLKNGRRSPIRDFIVGSGLKADGDARKVLGILQSTYKHDVGKFYKLDKNPSSAQLRDIQTKLIKDLLSEKPSLAGALHLFDQVANKGSVDDKINFLKAISAAKLDNHQEALLRRASNIVYMSNKNRYARIIAFPHHDANTNFLRYGRKDVLEAGKVLGPHFQGLLEKQMAAGEISETLVGMWIRCVDPKDKKAIAFMNKLVASPAWKKVNPAYLTLAADGNYFGNSLAVKAPAPKRNLSKEISGLPDKASSAQVKKALTAVISRLKTIPDFPGIYNLNKVTGHPAACDPFIEDIFNHYAPFEFDWRDRRYQALTIAYTNHLVKTRNYKGAQPLAQSFWVISEAYGDSRVGGDLVKLAKASLEAGDMSTTIGLCGIGMRFNSPTSRHNHEKDNRATLSSLYAKATEALGVADIPVQEGEPGYSIFKSQKEYVQSNLDTAWTLYDDHSDEFEQVITKLRHDYCFWLLTRNIEKAKLARAEEIVKQLTLWDRRGDGNLTIQHKAELKLSYADIALTNNDTGKARAWYRKVADDRQYKGAPQEYRALLGIVAADRAQKNYDQGLATLEKLMLVNDAEVRTKVFYAKAQIYYAQNKFVEALKEIEEVLRRNPKRNEAKILQAEIWLKMRRLEVAQDVEAGDETLREVIVPGEYVKIDLRDPSLNLAGTGASIEAEIRASSGDVERVMLRPLGDGKSKFRAEILTKLGAPTKGDKVLQVLGGDIITFGYSDRFRKKMRDLPNDPDEKIGIASDFRLDASAGAFPAREGERKLTIEELGLSTAERALGTSRVRPGNPIYVRVFDPDQCKSGELDEISIEVKSTNGDIIKSFTLKETGPYTGEFEGEVPTSPGQAVAYAYSSEPGRDPNMAISPADYPGWVGQVSSKSDLKYFTVDLNDNVGLKSMILSSPKGKELTQFIIQTSLNGSRWIEEGAFPESVITPFDGHPQYSVVATFGKGPAVPGLNAKSKGLPEEWPVALAVGQANPKIGSATGIVKNLKGIKLPHIAGHPGYSMLLRYRAFFYQENMAYRRFRLVGYPSKDLVPGAVFMIDGKVSKGDDPMEIYSELGPGLHEIQVWANANAATHSKAVILQDVDGADELQPCPDDMFDPKRFTEKLRETLPSPAKVTKTPSGDFEISFGNNTRAQLVRILIGSHAGEAPGISKITLTSVEGKQQLPVSADYQKLRQNKQLEVLPGDTVFIKYVDSIPYSRRRTQQEKRLMVAFNTATISSSFIKYQMTRDGRKQVFEDIRRFKMEDNVGFIVNDADMDISPERDKVPVMIRTSDGNSKKFTAYETEPHSGIFLCKVFPITGKPQRDSEIQMTEGGTLTAIYRDNENLDPGIPTDRIVTVEHARYVTPKFGAYTAVTAPLTGNVSSKQLKPQKTNSRRGDEETLELTPRLSLGARYLDQEQLKSTTPTAIYNSRIHFDVVAPHLALSGSSRIFAYAQTESGRKLAAEMRKKAAADGKPLPAPIQPFDITVPGTLKLFTSCVANAHSNRPPGYAAGSTEGHNSGKNSLDEGRFGFSVPLAKGNVQLRSFATKSAEDLPEGTIPKALNVMPGEKVYIGYSYLDKAGKPHWHTATYTLKGDIFFDIMDKTYTETVTKRFVGEKIFVRVVAPGLDTTNGRDDVTVTITAGSGASIPFTIKETFEHTGVFKGSFKIDYAKSERSSVDANTFFMHGFPVRYGDTVTVKKDGALPESYNLSINNGADGMIKPFSKRYTDSAMAIKTNFTLAECFFELAKKHRTMSKDKKAINVKKLESLSRREMKQAEKLLTEALATYRDPEQQAQAEYLLGNLAQEHADTSEDGSVKQRGYKEALALFSKIPQDYPDAIFAPKAQYKKAMVYEKMGEVGISVEEYVKLAYKYPEDELIPKAMSRISGQFEDLGLKQHKAASQKLEKQDQASQSEGLLLMDEANAYFGRAARIFTMLQKRYPDNELAGLAGVRAGENYIRIKDKKRALEVLEKVYENENYDGPTVLAAAMFWSAWCHELIAAERTANKSGGGGEHMLDAFKLYNRVRYEQSSTVWAKKSRGRLASKAFEQIIAADKKRRERLLEGLKSR